MPAKTRAALLRAAREPAAAAVPLPPDAAAASDLVPVDVDGVTLQLSPAAAAAITGARETPAAAASAADLEVARRIVAAAVPPAAPPAPSAPPEDEFPLEGLPDPNDWVTAPAQAQAQLVQALRGSLKRHRDAVVAQLRTEQTRTTMAQQRTQAIERLRTGFYEAFPDFRGAEDIADAVMVRKLGEWEASGRIAVLTTKAAYDELAAETLQRVAKVHTGTARLFAAAAPPRLEASAPRRPPAPPAAAEEPPAPRSMTDAIRELKARHGARRFATHTPQVA